VSGTPELSGGGLHSGFERITSIGNLSAAWREFKRGKSKKKDVERFSFSLEDNLLQLHEDLLSGRYRHGAYDSFYISDPKRRHIHKANVRDRVVHQAVFRVLYHHFDRGFIYDSYSCRFNKGTHRGVRRLAQFAQKVTKNNRRPAYVLKCDVKKFFANVDHCILLNLINRKVVDRKLFTLIEQIIGSFERTVGKGLPLGNVTSQLFANVYLNELDRFAKHTLKAKYYMRYCDDFVVLHHNESALMGVYRLINTFLEECLRLTLHKDKILIQKTSRGIDFLGYVVLPRHKIVRTSTKCRMLKRVNKKNLQSYLGILSHCRSRKIVLKLLQAYTDNIRA